MNISNIIMYIMVFFMLVGIFDKIFLNNRFGYGAQFDEGFHAMGSLAVAMLGFMCLSPVLGRVLAPMANKFFGLFNASGAMLAGTILGPSMGGFSLAKAMTSVEEIYILSGAFYAAMMGSTLTFGIPVSLGIVPQSDFKALAKGIMAGVIAMPFATFVGGLVAKFSLSILVFNLIPAFLLAFLLAFGLWKWPRKLLNGFKGFSKIITIVMHIALAFAIVEGLTGLVIIPGMEPILDQFDVIGEIAIVLAGAYPFVHFITQTFSTPLKKLGNLMGINEFAVAGLIATLANSLPMLHRVEKMDDRGKVIALAFMGPAAFVFGDHLAFASTNFSAYLGPFIVAKLTGGLLAIIVANIILGKNKQENNDALNKKAIEKIR